MTCLLRLYTKSGTKSKKNILLLIVLIAFNSIFVGCSKKDLSDPIKLSDRVGVFKGSFLTKSIEIKLDSKNDDTGEGIAIVTILENSITPITITKDFMTSTEQEISLSSGDNSIHIKFDSTIDKNSDARLTATIMGNKVTVKLKKQ